MEINFDIVAAVIFLYFVIRGAFSGAVTELIGLVGLIGGTYLAINYSTEFINYLPFTLPTGWEPILSFAIIIFGCGALAALLAFFIRNLLDLIFLGFLDHLLGAVIGLIKAFLVCAVLTYLAVNYFDSYSFVSSSYSIPYFTDAVEYLISQLPENVQNILE